MLNDLRYALRTAIKSPGSTSVIVLTLALGVGANTAIFSVLYAVLLKPLPFRDPKRLVRLSEATSRQALNVSYPNFLDWRARTRVFEDLAIYSPFGGGILTGRGRAEVVSGGRVEGRLFDMLGVRPALGRNFLAEEEQPGAERVVLISHRLWVRRFGRDPGVVGKPVVLDGVPATVVGVMPATFRLGTIDVWRPLGAHFRPLDLERGNHPGFQVFGRLRDGVDIDRARIDLNAVAAALEKQYPDSNTDKRVVVAPLLDSFVSRSRNMLLLVFGAVALLLLVACANVAGLLLARGLARDREVAVRAALGATRLRIVRLFLAESLVFGAVGAVAGLLVGAWGVRMLRAIEGLPVPRMADVEVGVPVLAYTTGLAAVTCLLFGTIPALQLSRVSLMDALRQAGTSTRAAGRRPGARLTLVAIEVALSVVLAAGAGLMLRSVARVLDVDPGFDATGLLAVTVSQPASGSDLAAARKEAVRFAERAMGDIETLSGVAAVAASWPLPYAGISWSPWINFPDRPRAAGTEPMVSTAAVTANYFQVLRIPLRRGRVFGAQDRPGTPIAGVVNESFARRFFDGGEIIGQRVTALRIPELASIEIVGVVGDTRRAGLGGGFVPELYVAFAQFATPGPSFLVRAASGDPLALFGSIDARLAAIDGDTAVSQHARLDDLLADGVADRRLLSRLLSVFAALALALTSIGVGGVIAFIVAERTQEIGIRLALGATPASIARLLAGRAAPPLAVGLALGAAGWAASARALKGFLFEVTAADPITLASVVVVIALAATVAACGPARRAMRLDPLTAIRSE